MTKKKKKESWKERKQRAAMKYQKALEAERLRTENRPRKSKGWSRSKVLGIGILVLTALVIGVYAAWQSVQPSEISELPGLYRLTDAEFSQFGGKVVVVDCFATWCEPCKTEFPHLALIHEEYNRSEVVVISVGSAGDSDIELREFRRDYNMTWLVARDTVGVFDKYGITAIPTIIILDPSGSVQGLHEGVTDVSTLSAEIDEVLGR
jgi:thiol-disulfide isomerase/thioredoxin